MAREVSLGLASGETIAGAQLSSLSNNMSSGSGERSFRSLWVTSSFQPAG
jgi:hypothetical protein